MSRDVSHRVGESDVWLLVQLLQKAVEAGRKHPELELLSRSIDRKRDSYPPIEEVLELIGSQRMVLYGI